MERELTRGDHLVITKLSDALRQFQTLDAEMQLPQAITLLTIALNEGISLTDLSERTQQSTPSASRNVAALSNTHRKGKPGHGLVISKEDPLERRRKQHWLTPKGRAFLRKLIFAIA